MIEDIHENNQSNIDHLPVDDFRFFAAVPLISKNNENIGCISLMHNTAKKFSAENKELLLQFSSVIKNEIEKIKAASIHFTGYQQEVAKGVKELASSHESLYNSNQELERFVYVTSHDLQEPVRKK